MGPADFHHVGELAGLGINGLVHALDRGNQRAMNAFGGGNVHGRGKSVVRGLRHVDVIVGMDGVFRAQHAAGQLDGAVGDHLVGVHVGLRAAAGLPDAQRELIVELAGNHVVGRLGDQAGLFRRELAELLIDQGRRLFQDAESTDQLGGHGVAADIEMHERAGGLRSPVDVGGHFNLAHAVGFDAGGFFCRGLGHIRYFIPFSLL